MKQNLFSFIILSGLINYSAKAQCAGGSNQGAITPTAAWQTVVVNTGAGIGRYLTFAATAGTGYEFSYCAANGGSATYDTQITILDNANVYAGGYNDDFCGLQSFVTWIAPSTATYRVLTNQFSCADNTVNATLAYRSVAPPTCPSGLGTGVINVASLPYASGAGTTCGMINDLTASNTITCGSTSYFGGEDRVWIFTPTATGTITVTLTSAGSWTGLMLYQGCPLNGQGGVCINNEQSSTGNKTFCTTVTSGLTYYLVLDVYPAPSCNPYSNLTISAPTGSPAGTICSNAPVITLPYTAAGHTTACYGNDYTNASTGSCASLYESGEDRVYRYDATTAECISITLSNASTSFIGFQVYNGCPGNPGTTCVANAGGSNPLTGTATLPGAGTYYIIVDTWAAPNNANYDISISSMGSGPSNDLPCNATPLGINVSLTGNNTCSGGSGEPATPACWNPGNVNTVWYSVVAPASGQLRIRTALGTLTNTQIALYSGVCSGLALVAGACNDDIPACGTTTYYSSEMLVTGLTPSATYYIRIDGFANLVGTFDIIATDGSLPVPPAQGQECVTTNPVCAQSSTVGNPGYQAFGNICDFPGGGTNCLASGERGSAWYTININAGGNLEFDIVPNDYGNPNPITGQLNPGWTVSGDETDYDFAVWKLVGTGSTTCAGIAAGAAPLRCNYNFLGVTGCFGAAANNAPPAYSPAYNFAYDSRIPVINGEVYVLVVSNFSNSTSGFSLVFSGGSPINYTPSSSSITWTGGTNTTWALANNWGNCSPPSCTIDATITPASLNQPVITANANVRNLTIQSGATLTINPGITLNICGNYINNGNLVASPTSTIVFSGSGAQTMTGAMVVNDKFGNLTINKTTGTVTTNANLDVGGSFTTANNTSIFNLNGMYMKVAGNFSNSTGGTTFTGVAGSTLEFNGGAPQTYTPGTGGLTLNNVFMNQTAASTLTLSGGNMTIGASGNLTLTQGRIITNALEVTVNNTSTGSVPAGNTSSYIEGNLRKNLSATGAFNFPVGHATTGYQRAWINFTAATTISNLLARFDPWVTVPGPQGGTECAVTYISPALNNGFFTVTASNSPTSGTYNMTLYNNNYTNNVGNLGWTIIKAATSAGPWLLNGVCAASTAAVVNRTAMNGFSAFGTGQTTSPLPIELISFEGYSIGSFNRLKWVTASESNNDYFVLESSQYGISFSEVARQQGAGTSSQAHYYEATDYDPFYGLTYYRLKQVDFDGNFTYSMIIAINNQQSHAEVLNVFPNPSSGTLSFDFVAPVSGKLVWEFIDAYGRIVLLSIKEVSAGSSTIENDLSMLSSGVYSLRISFPSTGFTRNVRVSRY